MVWGASNMGLRDGTTTDNISNLQLELNSILGV